MPVPGAPTMQRPAHGGTQSDAQAAAPVPVIPFTRAARKKRRKIGDYGPYAISTTQFQIPTIQVPANGFLRKIIFDFVGVESGTNAATVAFKNDGPFSSIALIGATDAAGGTIRTNVDGFAWYCDQKYGAYSHTKAVDPVRDPNYSKVTGSGATGGSFHFQMEMPFEFDSRDGAGSLANMAANQSYNIDMILNTIANIYSTGPTNAVNLTIHVTAEYWAPPAAQNLQGVPQATEPICNNLVNLLQVQTPPITASTDQTIQVTTVGNTIRHMIFILRDSSGVRTSADWPSTFSFEVNNDKWDYKTTNNWLRQLQENYGLTAGVATSPTLNSLDTGVFVYTDFFNDGSAGDEVVQGSSNRDLMLVTGSGTAINIEANQWGASASSLQVLVNALRVPDATAFYHPFGN